MVTSGCSGGNHWPRTTFRGIAVRPSSPCRTCTRVRRDLRHKIASYAWGSISKSFLTAASPTPPQPRLVADIPSERGLSRYAGFFQESNRLPTLPRSELLDAVNLPGVSGRVGVQCLTMTKSLLYIFPCKDMWTFIELITNEALPQTDEGCGACGWFVSFLVGLGRAR